MQRTITSRNYSPAERIIDIPPGLNHRFSGILATFTRENWPEGEKVLSVYFDRTTDDGATWQQIGGAAFPGGIQIHPRTGEIVTVNSIAFPYLQGPDGEPLPGDARIRVINTVTLRTAITAETIDA